MDGDEDKIARILRRLSGRARHRAGRVDCPDERTLAVFLTGGLADDLKKNLEAHLAGCSFCVEELVEAYQSAEGYDAAPQHLVQKAMALVQRKQPLFDLAVRLVKDSIELIRTSARVVPAPAVALRSAAKPSEANALQVEQEVGRFRIAVELELSEPGTCQVVANVTEETGAPAEGVRLSLNSGEREQASFLTRGGIVVFDRIAPGEYSIAVSESGTHVGRIRLSLIL
jgi:hypothetical protein